MSNLLCSDLHLVCMSIFLATKTYARGNNSEWSSKRTREPEGVVISKRLGAAYPRSDYEQLEATGLAQTSRNIPHSIVAQAL